MSANIIKDEMLDESEIKFEVDADYKEEFLKSIKPTTRKFYTYILQLADEYESLIGKSIFNFSVEDRDEFLVVKYKNKTTFSFQATLSPLKKYVDWCISKNFVTHFENRFASILTKDYEQYINVQATENSYIPLSENRELQKVLANDQDKLIIELLGLGVRGRTKKGNTLEELINFKVSDVNYEDKTISLVSNNDDDKSKEGEIRPLPVDDYTLDLIKRVINQTFYVFGNGFASKPNDAGVYEKTEKGFIINPTEYVFRVPGKNKFGKADHQLFVNRIQRIQNWLGKPYITVSSLYFSAMIDFAKEILDKKGKLEKEDYYKINMNFNFGDTKEKYLFKCREIMKTYLGVEE